VACGAWSGFGAALTAAESATANGFHLVNEHVISMAGQVGVPLVCRLGDLGVPLDCAPPTVDGGIFAKTTARLDCCRKNFLHPTGQIPAYEWNFSGT